MSGLCGDCGAIGCGCVLASGDGTTVTGDGSVGNPYRIATTVSTDSSIVGIGTVGLPLKLNIQHDASLLGLGTVASPLGLSSTAITHDASLAGTGSVASPLVLANVSHNISLAGAGIAASPLAVVPQSIGIMNSDVQIASLVDKQALLWETASGKFRNYKIGAMAGSNSLSTTPPTPGTAPTFSYSAFSTATTVANNTGKSVTGWVVVYCMVSAYQTANQLASFGCQVEINGTLQPEITVGMFNNSSTMQFTVPVMAIYPVTTASGANLVMRLRLCSAMPSAGAGCVYQAGTARAEWLAA